MQRIAILAAASAVALSVAVPAQAATEIQWWHALGGQLGQKVEEISAKFNASQSAYKVTPVYKGNYSEAMTAAIAAFRAKQPPHIVQVFEVGTATMMGAKGAVYPVYELMADAKMDFDAGAYLPAVSSYYTTTDGKMLSMPFNSSTPVLFYNKDAMAAAGIKEPPKTWEELADQSRKMIAAGSAKCGFTTGWPSWVQLENFSAIHNLPFATRDNGFAGFDAEVTFNAPLQVRHLQNLADWQKDKVFVYGGRRGDANPLFLNGECAFVMNSSAYYGGFAKDAKFNWGVAKLPYYAGHEPKNSIIGGATLWVMKGHQPAEYKGVAAFFKFLSSAEIQADWHQSTGYVPVTKAAYELTGTQGFYQKQPGTDIAVQQLMGGIPGVYSKGLRLGNFVQIRDLVEGEMENIFAGKKTAEQGLADAVAEGNKLLRKFEKAQR